MWIAILGIFCNLAIQLNSNSVYATHGANTWIVDSRSTKQTCNDRKWFTYYVEDSVYIETGAGSILSLGERRVPLKLKKSTGNF
jgi:hypothetical protein